MADFLCSITELKEKCNVLKEKRDIKVSEFISNFAPV